MATGEKWGNILRRRYRISSRPPGAEEKPTMYVLGTEKYNESV